MFVNRADSAGDAAHPAARRAIGRILGEQVRRHLPHKFLRQLDERLEQLAAQSAPIEWLPDFYGGSTGGSARLYEGEEE